LRSNIKLIRETVEVQVSSDFIVGFVGSGVQGPGSHL